MPNKVGCLKTTDFKYHIGEGRVLLSPDKFALMGLVDGEYDTSGLSGTELSQIVGQMISAVPYMVVFTAVLAACPFTFGT